MVCSWVPQVHQSQQKTSKLLQATKASMNTILIEVGEVSQVLETHSQWRGYSLPPPHLHHSNHRSDPHPIISNTTISTIIPAASKIQTNNQQDQNPPHQRPKLETKNQMDTQTPNLNSHKHFVVEQHPCCWDYILYFKITGSNSSSQFFFPLLEQDQLDGNYARLSAIKIGEAGETGLEGRSIKRK